MKVLSAPWQAQTRKNAAGPEKMGRAPAFGPLMVQTHRPSNGERIAGRSRFWRLARRREKRVAGPVIEADANKNAGRLPREAVDYDTIW
jgi:hypothetical protein